jgi:hypothetical protein
MLGTSEMADGHVLLDVNFLFYSLTNLEEKLIF